jgi:hypothetical protein
MAVKQLNRRKEICNSCHDHRSNGRAISDGAGYVTYTEFSGNDSPDKDGQTVILGACDRCGMCCGDNQEN